MRHGPAAFGQWQRHSRARVTPFLSVSWPAITARHRTLPPLIRSAKPRSPTCVRTTIAVRGDRGCPVGCVPSPQVELRDRLLGRIVRARCSSPQQVAQAFERRQPAWLSPSGATRIGGRCGKLPRDGRRPPYGGSAEGALTWLSAAGGSCDGSGRRRCVPAPQSHAGTANAAAGRRLIGREPGRNHYTMSCSTAPSCGARRHRGVGPIPRFRRESRSAKADTHAGDRHATTGADPP